MNVMNLAAVLRAANDESVSDGLNRWIEAGIAFGVAFAVASAARWAIRRFGKRSDTVTSTVQIMGRLVFFVIVAIGVYIALKLIGIDLGPVLAGAGIAGVAIAFALQDIAENYISGILMGFRNPFNPGDQISSGDHEGTVEELNLRYTTIRTYDGVRVLLPNAQVLKNPLTNLTANGDRRSDFQIGVAYGTDLDVARRVAIEAVTAAAGVNVEPAPQAWVEELAASWVNIRVRYWHSPRIADMWEVRSAAITAVYDQTAQQGVELPFERTIIELTQPTGTDAST
ncbi:MAG: mechanosensitive ion channel family protein [Ilumatobacter sp.]|uniref:mechanosensitive ion channel family protein n=1 Tax=Ilumatobacter sp. TaxID=1967498 RepID=UPI003C778B8F